MEGALKITIVGGGASGTLFALNLLRHNIRRPLELNFVEKSDRLGRGVAYSTTDDCHLLNVPAIKMGAFPDDVEHFHRWLIKAGYDYAPSAFVPRKIFGEYLSDLFTRAVDEKSLSTTLNLCNDEAVAIDVDESNARVELAGGDILVSDRVVLAFGNFRPPHPSVENMDFISAPKYFHDPWSQSVDRSIYPNDDVMIIGTGLSMVDFVMRYHHNNHKGKIYAISTRGLLPAVHKLGYSYPSFFDEVRPMTRITDILKAVRRHVEIASTDSSDWRAVIDSLRPHTQEIWLNLPTAEKRYFMQHLSRYWNVSRHRMPQEAANVIEQMQSSGQFKVMGGRLKKIEFANGRFDVEFAFDGERRRVAADALINCIGSESNFARIDSPFVKSLFAGGHIRNDSLSLGLDADASGTIINANGTPSRVLFTLGTALKGVLWESTAIPEIRGQAYALARRLLAVGPSRFCI